MRGDELNYMTHTIEIAEKVTKRNSAILAEIAKIFNSMGLLGSIVLYAKKIMQEYGGINYSGTNPS